MNAHEAYARQGGVGGGLESVVIQEVVKLCAEAAEALGIPLWIHARHWAGRISAPEQGQVRCDSHRTVHPNAVRDNDAKAVRVEACHLHLGRCDPIKGLRPRYC